MEWEAVLQLWEFKKHYVNLTRQRLYNQAHPKQPLGTTKHASYRR